MESGFHLCLLPQKVFNSVLHRNTVTSEEGNISLVFHEMVHLSALPSNLLYWAAVCSGFKCIFFIMSLNILKFKDLTKIFS